MTDTPIADTILGELQTTYAEIEGLRIRHEAELAALTAGLRGMLADLETVDPEPAEPAGPGPSFLCQCTKTYRGTEHRCTRGDGHPGYHVGAAGGTWENTNTDADPGPTEQPEASNTHEIPKQPAHTVGYCTNHFATGRGKLLHCRYGEGHSGRCRERNPEPGQKAHRW